MRTMIRWSAALGLALALAGCGDDDDGFTPTEDEVAGTYTATTFTAESSVGELDLLALGASVTATLDPDGTTTGRLFVPDLTGEGADVDEDLAGTWTLNGTTVTFNQTATSIISDVDFEVGPNTLTGEGTFQGNLLLLVLTRDE